MQWRWNRPRPVRTRTCEESSFGTHNIYEAFAWVPRLTISGYWVWLEHYFKEKCTRGYCKHRLNYRTVDLVIEELTK